MVNRVNDFTGPPPVLSPILAGLVGSASQKSSTVDPKELAVRNAFEEKFGAVAENKTQFHALMKEVYGADYDKTKAEELRQKALEGDYSWLPKVRFVDSSTLGGANGAYDKESGTVLLNKDLDADTLAATFLEEVGHHLDTMLKTSDTDGDEGEMFRRLASGERLTAEQKSEIRNENDKGKITVDGKQIEVEFWNPFKAIGKAVSGAVKGIAKGIGSVFKGAGKAVGSFFTGAFEGITGFFGNLFRGKIGDAFGALWRGVDKMFIRSAGHLVHGVMNGIDEAVRGATHLLGPLGKYARAVTDRVTSAARTIVTGAFDTVAGAIRNVAEGTGQFFKGIGKIFTGDFKEGFKDMGVGVFKAVGQTAIDATLLGGGKAVSAIQTLVGLEPPGRKLTDEEIAKLRKVYGDSIDYDQVIIKEGFSGLWSLNERAFVHGNTVYMKNNTIDDHLLIHELGHVWQHQNGGSDYMSEALAGQWWGDGYDWEKGVPGTKFEDLNPEQQAEFIADAYQAGYFDNPAGGFTRNGVDYTAYLEGALEMIRSGRGAP